MYILYMKTPGMEGWFFPRKWRYVDDGSCFPHTLHMPGPQRDRRTLSHVATPSPVGGYMSYALIPVVFLTGMGV